MWSRWGWTSRRSTCTIQVGKSVSRELKDGVERICLWTSAVPCPSKYFSISSQGFPRSAICKKWPSMLASKRFIKHDKKQLFCDCKSQILHICTSKLINSNTIYVITALHSKQWLQFFWTVKQLHSCCNSIFIGCIFIFAHFGFWFELNPYKRWPFEWT